LEATVKIGGIQNYFYLSTNQISSKEPGKKEGHFCEERAYKKDMTLLTKQKEEDKDLEKEKVSLTFFLFCRRASASLLVRNELCLEHFLAL
jgi:hypothetical protein